MRFTKLRRILVASLLAVSAGMGGATTKVASAQDIGGSFTFGNGGVNFQIGANAQYAPYFQDQLAPYGQWVQDPQYGMVFVPTATGFQPYTNGYWADTDQGLTWVSAYPFGNITEHYGRWVRGTYGWAWIPGDQWAPAWVSWYDTGNDLGWAPLGPDNEPIVDYGLTYAPYAVVVQQRNVRPYWRRDRDRFRDYYARSQPVERPAPILREHNYELRQRYIAPERLGRMNAEQEQRARQYRSQPGYQYRQQQQQYQQRQPGFNQNYENRDQYRQQYQNRGQYRQPQQPQQPQPQYRAPAPAPQPMRPQPMQRPQPQQRPQPNTQFRQQQEQQERQQLQQQLNRESQQERQRLGPNANQGDRQRLEQKQQQRQQQENQRLEQKQQQRRNQR